MQQTHHRSIRQDLLGNALKGAVAGAVGVWAMDRLDWFLFRRQAPQVRRQIDQARPQGMDPAHVAAGKAARLLGAQLQPPQPHAAGIAIHYALGIGPGALYGALRERLPAGRAGQDFLYAAGLGAGLFLLQDEGLNQAMGLSGRQKDYPWQAHARGLAAHLLLGLVTNTVLNLLQAPRPAGWQMRQIRTAQQAQSQRAWPFMRQENDFLPLAWVDATRDTGAPAR